MLWYSIHSFLNLFEHVIQDKTRNFTTFLLGVVLYTLFYTYFGTYGPEFPFICSFLKYAMYIILADGFVMAIIYKNYYNQTILTEVGETLGAHKPPMYAEAEVIKPIDQVNETNIEPIMPPVLTESAEYNDEEIDSVQGSTNGSNNNDN
jgi:hypothetical protein